MPEHTDRTALDAMWTRSIVEPLVRPRASWWSRVWTTITDDLFGLPYEPPIGEDLVLRRIRIHEKATAGARRLHKLSREEATEILVVTALLLGLEDTWTPVRRQGTRT